MENILTDLQVVLNDLDSDPSQLLNTKLQAVTATERTVRTTAFVLIPLGLGGVAVVRVVAEPLPAARGDHDARRLWTQPRRRRAPTS